MDMFVIFFFLFRSFFPFQLSLLMRFKIPSITDLKRTFLGILQSTGFLTTSAFAYSLFLCLLRRYIGEYNFFTVSYVPAFLSSMCALLIERPSRRGLLCLYVSNVATETWFRMAVSRNICRPIPHGQVLIFGFSIASMLYYYRKGLHQRAANPLLTTQHTTSKDSFFDIIRFVVGRHEEQSISQLVHPPPYMARRRERNANAPGTSSSSSTTVSHSNERRSTNNLYLLIQHFVQFYINAMKHLKYKFGRHRTCPHTRTSCVYYVLQGGCKLFTIGVGLQVMLKCILQMKAIIRKPKVQLKKIFGNRDTIKLGIFLGGFAGLFRVIIFYFAILL